MAGRGRGKTLPAWMVKQQQEQNDNPVSSLPPSMPSGSLSPAPIPTAQPIANALQIPGNTFGPQQFAAIQALQLQQQQKHLQALQRGYSSRNSVSDDTNSTVPGQFTDAPSESNGRSKRSSRSSRSRSYDRRRRDRSRSKEHSRHSSRGSRRSSRKSSRSQSRSHSPVIRRRRRKSNFDVRPPGVTDENAAAYAANAILQANMAALSGAVGPASFGPPAAVPVSTMGAGPSLSQSSSSSFVNSQLTAQSSRHARRIYVGGIGEVSEQEITTFFNDIIGRALGKYDSSTVVSVYINRERHFAFVELKTIELTTACMGLDGVSFRGQPLKIRRPNDYNPASLPSDLGPIPVLNLAALGIVSTTVADGPGKVFIGGIPYHLTEDQIKELLQAFGALKSFHLVKEANSNLSKGYGFCEYMDPNVTDIACQGLNDMPLGEKTLTVRRAMSQTDGKITSNGTIPNGGRELGLGLDPQLAAQQTLAMANYSMNSGNTSIPKGTPSRVIKLLNMVTVEELTDPEEYNDILDDIKTECESFGPVSSILIPRPSDSYGMNAVGKVFVEFNEVHYAQVAANELHGRGFSNRTVEVEYLDEHKYGRQDLS